MEYKDKVCVVTGGANGIGRCISENFYKQGAFVACIDTDRVSGDHLQSEFKNDQFFFYCGDITEEAILIDFSKQVINRFHQVDCLIHNACISNGGILTDCGYEDFNYVLKLGITAPYMLTKLFLPHFAKGACVINISSTRAFMSQPNTESYTAAKGGITALTHSLSISLSGKVRVNSVSPGWIDTCAYQKEEKSTSHVSTSDSLQHPAGRIGNPQDIADTVLFLCSEKAGFITGENITVDGGMTKQMIYHQDYGWSYHGKEE